MLKASFVIPWYGSDIPGGAEAECRGVAENLAARGVPVEVLTTCLHSHGRSWDEDFHPPGETEENGVLVRRFSIDPRNGHLFNLLNRRIMSGLPLPPRQEISFLENMVNSRALYQYIASAKGRLFLPLPYLFSTSWMTARLAPGRTVPITCLHDEGYAYLQTLRQVYRSCRNIAFLSRAEQKLAQDLWGVNDAQGRLMGGGLDTDLIGDSDSFRAKYHITEPFILYAGRRDPTKNTPLLIDCFARYKRTHQDSDLKLVLIGNQPISVPPGLEKEVKDLGFVSREDKAGAFAAASLFCQPSVNESFSIVIMESWLNHTPVLVHNGCAVTRDHAQVSGGGLTFSDAVDFSMAVDLVLSDQGRAFALAEAGRRYVMKNFTWDVVCEKYIRLLEDAETSGRDGNVGIGLAYSQPQWPRLRQIIASVDPGLNILGESWSITHQLKSENLDGGLYLEDPKGSAARGCRPLSWLDKDTGPLDQVMVHFDLARPDLRLAEAATSAPVGRLLVRVHGRPQCGTNVNEALAPFFGLNRFLRVLFLTETGSDKSALEENGFGPVEILRPVVTHDILRVNTQYYADTRFGLVLTAHNPKGLEQSLKPLTLLRRIDPQVSINLLCDNIRPNGINSIMAKRMGLSFPHIFGLADLGGFISRAGVLLCTDDAGNNWAVAQAIEAGVPVIYNSEGSPPSLLAEIINVLLGNQEFRQAFARDQKQRMGKERQNGVNLLGLLKENSGQTKEAADG